MLKLVRNTLGDKLELCHKAKVFIGKILCPYKKLQETEDLKAGTEITKRHIMFKSTLK